MRITNEFFLYFVKIQTQMMRPGPEELQLSLIELIHILNISNIHVWLLLQMREIFIIINFKERKQTQITNVCRHWKVQNT